MSQTGPTRRGTTPCPGAPDGTSSTCRSAMLRFDPRLIRDDNNVVVKIKQYRRVLSDRSRPKKERQRAHPVLRPFRLRHPPAAARRRPRRPRRQRHPDPVLRRGHQPPQALGFRPDPPDRRRRPSLGLPGRAGHHARGDQGVVQGIGRRLGRREPASRQARLPPTRRCPQDHPPGLQAGRVLPRASGADPQETDGESFRPPGE